MAFQAGSLVVSYVVSAEATWACLILLLAVHLGMNHAAVRAVQMNTLNRQRACLCLSHMFDTGQIMDPTEVSKKERIFERSSFIRWKGGSVLLRVKIGASMNEVVSALGIRSRASGSVQSGTVSLAGLLDLFAGEDYLLWFHTTQQTILIALKRTVRPASQLKAWAHAMLVGQKLQDLSVEEKGDGTNAFRLTASTLQELNDRWEGDAKGLVERGWDLDTASLETLSGTRVYLAVGNKHG